MQPAYFLPCPLYPKTGLHPAPDQSTLLLHKLFIIHPACYPCFRLLKSSRQAMFSICPQYGYSTWTLAFYECCPDPDWCCFCWQLVESTLVRLAANLISFCEENSTMFWVVSVCPITVMNVTPTLNEDLLYCMYLSCFADKLRHGA